MAQHKVQKITPTDISKQFLLNINRFDLKP